MTSLSTTDYVCLLPFDFADERYVDICDKIIDYGMGITIEYMFEAAFNVMFELKTIEDIIVYLDQLVFPEHVPNDSLSVCLSLSVHAINYLLNTLAYYREYLNLIVLRVDTVELEYNISTVRLNFDVSDARELWNI